MSGVLVDTDVLVAACRAGKGDPRADKAKAVLENLARLGNGFVSVQNLAEFSCVVLDKPAKSVPPSRVREALACFESVFGVLAPTDRTLNQALLGVEKHGLAFWDSMLWALAHENGLEEVLTEELPPRSMIEGIRYRNPLA